MKLFADKLGLSFDAELLSQNAGYLRNALVMAAVNEAPEPSYLYRIITDFPNEKAYSFKGRMIVRSNKEWFYPLQLFDIFSSFVAVLYLN